MHSLSELKDLSGKRVLVRVDFNIPQRGEVLKDDTRIRAALPTLRYLQEQNARIIVLTHIGRPGGAVVEELRTAAVARRLGELLDTTVQTVPDLLGPAVEQAVDALQDGELLMLENVRFSPDEKKNSGTLAKDLATLAELFVFDAFAVAHRSAASVSGIAQYIPSYAGFLLEKEMQALGHVLEDPAHPFTVIIGGVKVETKIPVLAHLGKAADHVLVAGGAFNAYVKARGYEIGSSVVDNAMLEEAQRQCSAENVVLPEDVIIGKKDGTGVRTAVLKDTPHAICSEEEAILDIGPQTVARFSECIATSKTVVWSGSLGYYSQAPYDTGTRAVAKAIAATAQSEDVFTVVGGGDTLLALTDSGAQEAIDLVSTGGGAMLEFLAGKTLPGIAALQGDFAAQGTAYRS